MASYNNSEFIDFAPVHSHPLTSALHEDSTSATVGSPMQTNVGGWTPGSYENGYAPILSLEKDFCSNFTCCGLALADMHELLDHFEESHVVVLGGDGRPVYPPPVHAPSYPSGSLANPAGWASLAVDYPQPYPPADASFQAYAPDASGPLPATPTVESSFQSYPPTAFTLPPHMRVPSPAPRFQTPYHAQNPASGVLDPHRMDVDVDTQADSHSPSDEVEESALHPGPRSPMSRVGTPSVSDDEEGREKDKKAAAGRIKAKLFNSDSDSAERKSVQGLRKRDSRREKAYKCPHPGCIKSYLNPNGLKYHLEKGTCIIDPNYRIPSPGGVPSDDHTPDSQPGPSVANASPSLDLSRSQPGPEVVSRRTESALPTPIPLMMYPRMERVVSGPSSAVPTYPHEPQSPGTLYAYSYPLQQI
ncbi:hypothetical protein EW026_g3255 [Hermanssonia centrifuga]|uniref:C2H2-type domain-containing protein n=1 Tax=Hermanssonia centrifuga TaxID=98765 RepID=A0A4S4KKQ1_9APHY|nr:hypothetical protein EW026_g3255 [Hermanssonia centrifuga]